MALWPSRSRVKPFRTPLIESTRFPLCQQWMLTRQRYCHTCLCPEYIRVMVFRGARAMPSLHSAKLQATCCTGGVRALPGLCNANHSVQCKPGGVRAICHSSVLPEWPCKRGTCREHCGVNPALHWAFHKAPCNKIYAGMTGHNPCKRLSVVQSRPSETPQLIFYFYFFF